MPESRYYPHSIPLRELRENTPTLFTLEEGLEIVVVKSGGKVRLFKNECPHMGGPLHEGDYCPESRRLSCPWHGYAFSTETGAFLENPNRAAFSELLYSYKSYDPSKEPKFRLHDFDFDMKDEEIFVLRSRREI